MDVQSAGPLGVRGRVFIGCYPKSLENGVERMTGVEKVNIGQEMKPGEIPQPNTYAALNTAAPFPQTLHHPPSAPDLPWQ